MRRVTAAVPLSMHWVCVKVEGKTVYLELGLRSSSAQFCQGRLGIPPRRSVESRRLSRPRAPPAHASAMPDAGKKRSYDEEDEPAGKKSRGDGDSKDSAVHVYQPCVVLPELAGKMNSLVEVCLTALILGALRVSAPAL